MNFVLKGATLGDVGYLNAGQVLPTMRTIDDTKVGTFNLWTSDKISKSITDNQKIGAAGTAEAGNCFNSGWLRFVLTGLDAYSSSLIYSANKMGVIVPRAGKYLLTLCIFEGAKTARSTFSIEKYSLALNSTGAGICYNFPNGGNKCPIQCKRIMSLTENEMIDFRYFQAQNCRTFEYFTWSIEEL